MHTRIEKSAAPKSSSLRAAGSFLSYKRDYILYGGAHPIELKIVRCAAKPKK